MRTLKQIIGRFMRMTAFILVCVILITTACIQINLEKTGPMKAAFARFPKLSSC